MNDCLIQPADDDPLAERREPNAIERLAHHAAVQASGTAYREYEMSPLEHPRDVILGDRADWSQSIFIAPRDNPVALTDGPIDPVQLYADLDKIRAEMDHLRVVDFLDQCGRFDLLAAMIGMTMGNVQRWLRPQAAREAELREMFEAGQDGKRSNKFVPGLKNPENESGDDHVPDLEVV